MTGKTHPIPLQQSSGLGLEQSIKLRKPILIVSTMVVFSRFLCSASRTSALLRRQSVLAAQGEPIVPGSILKCSLPNSKLGLFQLMTSRC